MTPSDLLEQFRDEMGDDAAPYLWSDELVMKYIADAERMFYRLTDGIADATTPAVTQIAITPTNEWYDLHKSILKIRDAYRTDTGLPVNVVNQEDTASHKMRFDGREGALDSLIVGAEDHKVRAWPVPNETVTVQLTVFRLPLTPTAETVQFGMDEQHHEHLLLWVKHRAYLKQDAEAFDRSRAKDFDELFRAYCAAAKTEQRRARHKQRAVMYSGI